MKENLPPLFLERLRRILPEKLYVLSSQSFGEKGSFCARINTIKTSKDALLRQLRQAGLDPVRIAGIPDVLVFDREKAPLIQETPFFTEGLLFRQNLSSILVARLVGPEPEENILDMCAAPGGKTTQLAAMMGCRGTIVALEAIRKRYYKLRSIVSLLGASNVTCVCMDARRYQARDGLFDRVLLDAQCSCEAGFREDDPATFAYWSLRKIKELSYKQKGLILAAGRLLKPGGSLVYSTCTFAPEENEMVIDWFLKKSKGDFEVEKISVGKIDTYPALLEWQGRSFDPSVKRCLRIVPSGLMEGFFIARLRKIR
jgi:tRNA (cytosine49-C5)-methyltransferase